MVSRQSRDRLPSFLKLLQDGLVGHFGDFVVDQRLVETLERLRCQIDSLVTLIYVLPSPARLSLSSAHQSLCVGPPSLMIEKLTALPHDWSRRGRLLCEAFSNSSELINDSRPTSQEANRPHAAAHKPHGVAIGPAQPLG